jgi:hypothetical protein
MQIKFNPQFLKRISSLKYFEVFGFKKKIQSYRSYILLKLCIVVLKKSTLRTSTFCSIDSDTSTRAFMDASASVVLDRILT